ncbi:hypothetical protein TNCV_4518411 [Trichonephila clavipes]|nr:hypothetical protein TNCV_4518411 [Trichonephila clavipes]
MWVRLGSTDLMAGKVMFLRSNQGDRLDGNESVADSFRSDLVGFKSWSGRILGAFLPSYVCQKKPPVGKRTCYPGSPLPGHMLFPIHSELEFSPQVWQRFYASEARS